MANEERSASEPESAGVESAETAASSAGVASGAAHEDIAGQDDVGDGQTVNSSAAGGEAMTPAAENADQDGSTGGAEERRAVLEVETAYERVPGGHRVTRRTVRRKKKTSREHVEETITEDLPIPAYSTPRGAPHPAPVG